MLFYLFNAWLAVRVPSTVTPFLYAKVWVRPVEGPNSCSSCAGFGCEVGRCDRPWISSQDIDSFFLRHTCAFPPGYKVLKRWKTTQGFALDRKILTTTPRLSDLWRTTPVEAITWVPQSYEAAPGFLALVRLKDLARWTESQTGRPRRKRTHHPPSRSIGGTETS